MKEELDNDLPAIPKIRNEELRHAVSALAQSGDAYRQVFLQVLQGASPTDLLSNHLELLKSADVVIEKWLNEFKEINTDLLNNDADPIKN